MDCIGQNLMTQTVSCLRLMKYNGEQYALILEVIHNHAYEKSKFLPVRIPEEKNYEKITNI